MAYTPKPWRKELHVGLRNYLLADEQLSARLTGGIWRMGEERITTYPALSILFEQPGDSPEFVGVGNLKPTVRINIYGTDGDTLDEIDNDLRRLLTIPVVARAGITLPNYRITLGYQTNAYDSGVPVRELQDEKTLLWLPTEWQFALRQIG